ncbi:MAG: ABC transporter ATP-binding protein [Oscillospiraceae bacterium]
MATVTLKNVKKIYDNKVTAVHDFNLEIADKEFIVLVGPSGCGKSTTLRMVAGLEEISEGDLFIDDARVNDVEPKDRDIAMVFQSYALYPHMTVRENMEFPLKLKKMPKEEIRQRVDQAAEILGITEYLDRKPKALSGGQRQRVAIGRAIVREPKVLLMDEPLSNLDAKLRNQMRSEIIKLRQRINTTFIYVTHDQTEAMTLGDRIVIMKDGFIQQIGTPQEVFSHPANLFVAGFIGTPQMNFFPAKLVKNGAGYQAECAGAVIALDAAVGQALAEKDTQEQEIVLGCRPEHLELAGPDDAGAVPAQVEVSEMMGSELHIHAVIGGESEAAGKEVVLRVPTTKLPGEYQGGIPYGTGIRFGFPGGLVHLFDKETEQNLL